MFLTSFLNLVPCRRRSSPRVDTVQVEGKAARREAASLLLSRRPARVEAAARLRVSHAAGMRNRSKRKTHSDQLAWDEAQGALRSRCPADEAINPSHRTNAQRMRRSTPARRTGVLRVKDQRQTSPDGRGPRTKDQCQTPSIRPALVAKDQRQTPQWPAFPRGRL